jgi:hypothetical protein
MPRSSNSFTSCELISKMDIQLRRCGLPRSASSIFSSFAHDMAASTVSPALTSPRADRARNLGSPELHVRRRRTALPGRGRNDKYDGNIPEDHRLKSADGSFSAHKASIGAMNSALPALRSNRAQCRNSCEMGCPGSWSLGRWMTGFSIDSMHTPSAQILPSDGK